MPNWVDIIATLDREIGEILSEYSDVSESVSENLNPDTEKNIVDSTEKNVVDSTKKNEVDITSKNFISSELSNVIHPPFIERQDKLQEVSVMRVEKSSISSIGSKGPAKSVDSMGKSLQDRIANLFNF